LDNVGTMAEPSPGRGAVVITGASTGIGHACALDLDSRGFRVFAGVRRDEDAERLRAERPSIEPIRIDVTDADSIAAARDRVAEAVDGAGLAGLVNNAGIAVPGPLEHLPIDELRRQLEVNLVGQVAVTQAFIPLLRTARGRIVNIGSIGGRVALPLLGPYAASKHAMEGLTDSLRRELRPWGIQVSIVRPGPIATEIWQRGNATADDLLERMPGVEADYGPAIERGRAFAAQRTREAVPPSNVAEVVAHAMTADKPRTRYLVGPQARMLAALRAVLPDRWFDALLEREGRRRS
jgi:NAD(P)-dependent dehydrogenase (short-subunit alcohol dehydrogenase family)